LATIRELAGSHTVLLSTHILSEVEAVCERVIIISRGKIGLDERLDRLGDDTAVIALEARGPAEQIANVLRQVDGVRKVVHQPTADGLNSYEIRTAENADVRELVFQRIAAHPGWTIRRLDLRRRKLEDHFVEVVLREESAAAAARVA
jgi:ABC-2 type transport system ATP-binding protein